MYRELPVKYKLRSLGDPDSNGCEDVDAVGTAVNAELKEEDPPAIFNAEVTKAIVTASKLSLLFFVRRLHSTSQDILGVVAYYI
jgi:hypothetical protein